MPFKYNIPCVRKQNRRNSLTDNDNHARLIISANIMAISSKFMKILFGFSIENHFANSFFSTRDTGFNKHRKSQLMHNDFFRLVYCHFYFTLLLSIFVFFYLIFTYLFKKEEDERKHFSCIINIIAQCNIFIWFKCDLKDRDNFIRFAFLFYSYQSMSKFCRRICLTIVCYPIHFCLNAFETNFSFSFKCLSLLFTTCKADEEEWEWMDRWVGGCV